MPHNDHANAAVGRPNRPDNRSSDLSVMYRSNPTIANYVTLRRAHPEETIRLAISGSLESLESLGWLYENADTLKRFDIPLGLVFDVLAANHRALSELSLRLMQCLILHAGRSYRPNQI